MRYHKINKAGIQTSNGANGKANINQEISITAVYSIHLLVLAVDEACSETKIHDKETTGIPSGVEHILNLRLINEAVSLMINFFIDEEGRNECRRKDKWKTLSY